MFSRLDPVFRTLVRKIEQTDPRMDIRKDGHDSSGSQDQKDKNLPLAPPVWDDFTEVATTTLMAFLETMIGIATQRATPLSESSSSPLPTADEDHAAPLSAPHDPVRAHAIKAYQHSGTSQATKPILDSTVIASDLHIDMGPEEISVIRSFISDLYSLHARGVEFISLRRSATFLASIDEGIATAKIGM